MAKQNVYRIVSRDGGELSSESQELQDALDAIYGPIEYLMIPKGPPGEPNREQFATPEWLTEAHHKEMRRIYRNAYKLSKMTGIPHQVDHMVPIRGKTVCGLHVPWNLRIITALENSRKTNQLLPEFAGGL